jgi:hypothetical protein
MKNVNELIKTETLFDIEAKEQYEYLLTLK